MNDELIERLAELLEYKLTLHDRRFWSDAEYAEQMDGEAKGVHAIMARIRELIGVATDATAPRIEAGLREVFK